MSEALPFEVLVVDDEEVVVGAVARILTAHSVRHRLCGSAEEAMRQIETKRPNLLLADIKLPGKSGLDLVRTCAGRYPEVVPICMTGYANAEHVLLSLEGGAVDFLPKPFTVEEVMSTLNRAARLIGGEPPTPVPAGYRFLDGHSWVRREDDGTVTLGLVEAFVRTVGPIESVEVPAPNTMLRQGGVLTRVTTRDGQVHRAWSAAGGRVEQSNEQLATRPQLANAAPYGNGWITSVMPTSFDDEIARLRTA